MSIRKRIYVLALWTLPLWLIAVAGCKPGLIGPEKVPPQNRIMLAGESGSGAWDTNDLVVGYQYRREPGRLTISGEIEFFGGVSNFDAFERFSLTLYLLNEAGDIIGNRRIAAAGYYKEVKPISFDRTIQLPDGTVAMAFGYNGTVVSGGSGDDGGSSWQFWETPGD